MSDLPPDTQLIEALDKTGANFEKGVDSWTLPELVYCRRKLGAKFHNLDLSELKVRGINLRKAERLRPIAGKRTKRPWPKWPQDYPPELVEYLSSERWKKREVKRLAMVQNQCDICSGGSADRVVHRNYDRLGKEKRSDVMVLCYRCHRAVHHCIADPRQFGS